MEGGGHFLRFTNLFLEEFSGFSKGERPGGNFVCYKNENKPQLGKTNLTLLTTILNAFEENEIRRCLTSDSKRKHMYVNQPLVDRYF